MPNMPEGLLSWGHPDCEWVRDYYEFEVGGATFRVVIFEGTAIRFMWYLYSADHDLPMRKPFWRTDGLSSGYSDFIWGCRGRAREAANRHLLLHGLQTSVEEMLNE